MAPVSSSFTHGHVAIIAPYSTKGFSYLFIGIPKGELEREKDKEYYTVR
jgi:hypothetical protein